MAPFVDSNRNQESHSRWQFTLTLSIQELEIARLVPIIAERQGQITYRPK